MATIDRDKLREDVKFWLPDGNTLSDGDIERLNEMAITKFGDDDEFYNQILCYSLQLAGKKNMYNATVGGQEVKKEKLGPLEIENFKSDSAIRNPWSTWLKNDLPGICVDLGCVDCANSFKFFDIYFTPAQDEIDIFDGQCDDYTQSCSY